MKRPQITKLHRTFLAMNVIPIVILGMIITIFSANRFASSMNQEAQNGLLDLCNTLESVLDKMHPGDYHMEMQDGELYFLKGDYQFNGNYELIDSIKERTDADVTIFYKDVRVITTIKDKDGKRMIGTKASTVVKRDVLDKGEGKFYPSVLIEDKKYFAYYAPIFDAQKECIGMIFVAKPAEMVDKLVFQSIFPIVGIALLVIIIVAIITARYTSTFVRTIYKIEVFMSGIAKGRLHDSLDYEVLKREDELDEMGRNAVRMQKSLRELVEEDILTGLNNRRSGEKMLQQTFLEYKRHRIPFSIALGDIDFFKKVNDTYGHECGDMVLMEVSKQLKMFMHGKGYAIRWGGEEFLLVFSNCNLETGKMWMEELLDTIRKDAITYRNEIQVAVTMTFGIVEGNEKYENIDDVIVDADSKLYFGKQNGRNQIVSSIVELEEDDLR